MRVFFTKITSTQFVCRTTDEECYTKRWSRSYFKFILSRLESLVLIKMNNLCYSATGGTVQSGQPTCVHQANQWSMRPIPERTSSVHARL